MSDTASCKIGGMTFEYTLNSTSTYEKISVNGKIIADASGDVGPWRGRNPILLGLHGAALASAQQKIIDNHLLILIAAAAVDGFKGGN